MNKNTRTALLALATTAAIAVPLAGYAFAQSGQAATAQTSMAQGQKSVDNDTETQDDQASAYTSSIQVPSGQKDAEMPDAQEEVQLRALARVTPAQASQAAQAAVPGSVASVKLENENGNLVYAVVIGNKEVKVDAGNGRVLHQEAADQQDSGQNESAEQGDINGK